MSLYNILEVSQNDDIIIIKNSYINLLKKAKQQKTDINILNNAYNVLKNSDSRIKYDILLKEQYYNENQNEINSNAVDKIFSNSEMLNNTNNIYIENTLSFNQQLQNLQFKRDQDIIENNYSEEFYKIEQPNDKNVNYSFLNLENNDTTDTNDINIISIEKDKQQQKQKLIEIENKYKDAIKNKNWNEISILRNKELAIFHNSDKVI